MKRYCEPCDGTGMIAEKNNEECPECDGDGFFSCCISEYKIQPNQKHADRLLEIKSDALLCISQHKRLLEMNPRAKDSYDRQLAQTLAKLNAEGAGLQ